MTVKNVDKIRAFWDTLTTVTGINARHNKALRNVQDWAEILRTFFIAHGVYGNPDFNLLTENIGKAKFDLIYITYKGRMLINEAKYIRGKPVLPLITVIVADAENLKRELTNLSSQDETIREITLSLRKSFEKLKDVLSDKA